MIADGLARPGKGGEAASAHSVPLVISGPPRSGTTLLYTLFDGHPDIFWMISEGYFFEYLDRFGDEATQMMCDASDRDIDDLVDGLREKELLPDLRDGYRQESGTTSKIHVEIPWDEARFRAALATVDRSDIGALWRSLVRAFAAGIGSPPARYACLKSPDYGRSAAAAARHFSASRTLIIARDPLYVANSLKRSRDMRGAKRLTWPGLAELAASLNAMARRTAGLPKARAFVVRYEDLVRDPAGIMSRIAAWLDVEMRPCLLEPTILGKAWPGHSSFAPTQGIEQTPADRKLTALDDSEVVFLRKHAGAYAQLFGYEL